MNEQDNKTEDKCAEINKLIRDLSQAEVLGHMRRQASLPDDHPDKDIDTSIKVNRQFTGHVLLDEGKNTANIGLNGGAGGFNVTFIETVAAPDAVDDDSDDTEEGTA